MPKVAQKLPPRKKTKQASLLGDGSKWVQTFKREPTLVDSDIILTEDVWDGRVPDGFRDIWFHYVVTGYHSPTKTFTAKYQKKMIHKDGDRWEQDDEARRESIPDISVETVDKGIRLYNKKFSDIKDRQLKEEESKNTLLKQKAGDDKDGDDNMHDLDEAAESSEKKWFGEEVIKVEFELTGEEG